MTNATRITEHTTECWGQTYAVRADWSEASSPVQVRYEDEDWANDPHGRQVADFRHSPDAALRSWILAGEDADDPEVIAAVDTAMKYAG